MCLTTARLWLMNSIAVPNSCCKSSSKLTICPWMDTSRELTGSSHISKLGAKHHGARDADALALAAAEFVRVAPAMPRDRPTRSSMSSIRARRAGALKRGLEDLQRFGQSRAHGQRGLRLASGS
jgi:hypothetical protein